LLYHGSWYQWIRYKSHANTEGKLMDFHRQLVGEDAPRSQPAVRQVLQCGQERVQPRLVQRRRYPVVPGGGLLPQHLAGVGGGRGWRCGGRTTPAPTPRCWRSSCRGCTPPCASSATQATTRRCAPRGESSASTWPACAIPRGRGGPRDPSLPGSPESLRRRRRTWPPARSCLA
jgi:hypothetical protein